MLEQENDHLWGLGQIDQENDRVYVLEQENDRVCVLEQENRHLRGLGHLVVTLAVEQVCVIDQENDHLSLEQVRCASDKRLESGLLVGSKKHVIILWGLEFSGV